MESDFSFLWAVVHLWSNFMFLVLLEGTSTGRPPAFLINIWINVIKWMNKVTISKGRGRAHQAGGGSTRQGADPPGRGRAHQAGGGSTRQGAGPPGRGRAHQAGGGPARQGAGPPGRRRVHQAGGGPTRPEASDSLWRAVGPLGESFTGTADGNHEALPPPPELWRCHTSPCCLSPSFFSSVS